MRYDTNNLDIAKGYDILNNCSEIELMDIFRTYGDEKNYEPLVKNIVLYRDSKRFLIVDDYLKVIDKTFKAHSKDLYNVYTRLFQALRIAVNYEIFNIKRFLNKCFTSLEDGAIICIITFHSLEDGIVMKFFKELEKRDIGKIIYKPAIKPSKVELDENSRSRSAMMRVFVYKKQTE
jgi:16S rRNA (cytosine1402-N4)-methyltransferase